MPNTFKRGSRHIPIDNMIKPTDHDRILACGEQMAVEWQNVPQDTDPNYESALTYLVELEAVTGVWIVALERELALSVEFTAYGGVGLVRIYGASLPAVETDSANRIAIAAQDCAI
jgi:hypothetical protein